MKNYTKNSIAIIGAGPSGLIAAEILSNRGFQVTVFDQKPSAGRKFLMAGRGGLNLTHSEPAPDFVKKYADAAPFMKPLLDNFTPENLRDWSLHKGEETFIGSSGRVFPKSFKASPLLRAWLKKLIDQNVQFMFRNKWTGWEQDQLSFENEAGLNYIFKADATLLALGGASWPTLGSDGTWSKILREKSISINDFKPSNCGFRVEWSEIFKSRFSGQALKNISLRFHDHIINGEVMIDEKGIEGGAIYALSRLIRDEILTTSRPITLYIDLKPDLSLNAVLKKLSHPRNKMSLSNYLAKTLNLNPLAIHLLREVTKDMAKLSNDNLAELVKSVPVEIYAPFSIEKSISSAGGIRLDELDKYLMLKKIPGVFAAGEMLDWEAPTGGYLLQACFSSGVAAAEGIQHYLSGYTKE